MIKTIGLIFTAGLFLLSPGIVLAQGTFFLKQYRVESISSNSYDEQQARWLVRVAKPEDLKGLPEGLGQRVYYYSGTIGDREVIALIESGKSRTLYIDLDGDRNLSNEQPLTGKRVRSAMAFGWTQSYRFGPVSLQDEGDGTEAAKPAGGRGAKAAASELSGGAFYVEQFDLDYLLVRAAVCRRGVVRIKNTSYPVLLTDGNFNGRYDDTFRFAVSRKKEDKNSKDSQAAGDASAISSDFLGIDLNRNGRFDRDAFWGAEVQALTKLIQLGGAYYSVQVAPDGSSITLDEGTPELGTLDIGKQQADIMVMSENGTFSLKARGEPVKLPVGKYRLVYVVLHGTDSKNVRYSLSGRAPDTKVCHFEISKDGTTALKFGPPLKVTASQRTLRNLLIGKVVSFNVRCTDKLGIDYQVSAQRAGRVGVAPSVKILDEKGKTLSVGKFEYG